ncbi:MAG: four helix bundle protein [Chromatiales bacterium]|nr:four helix bundle protein [Chromatiales bacterium]
MIKSYRDLSVWQDGMRLVVDVYRQTSNYPSEEKFGLQSQIRRAAVSAPANIAEGHARGTRREYHRFTNISMGSLAELETHILLSESLEYLSKEQSTELLVKCDELERMLRGLLKKLASQSPSP